MNNDFDAQIESAGQYYNVDPRLIKTVFHVESNGNPKVGRGAAGEIGAFQIMPSTAKRLGLSDPSDMSQAIPAAARLLSEGLDKTGNAAGALAYYNSGRTENIPASTVGYVNRASQLYPNMTVRPSSRAPNPQDNLESKNADDPFVQSGKDYYQQITGQPAPESPNNEHKSDTIDVSSDPYVDAGKEYFKSLTGRDPDNPDNTAQNPNQPAMPAPNAQADTVTGASAPQSQTPGFADSLLAGGLQGAKDVYNQVAGFVNSADNTSPWLSALDSLHGFTPQQRAQTMSDIQASNQKYQTMYGDQPAAAIGRIGGNIAATAPFGGLAGKAILGAGEIAGVSPWIARMAAGAAQGATGAELTGQDPTVGAVAGGALSGAANLAGPIANGMQKLSQGAGGQVGKFILQNTPSWLGGAAGHAYGGPAHAVAGWMIGKSVGDIMKSIAEKYGQQFADKVADAVRENPELIQQLNLPTILGGALNPQAQEQ